MPGQRKEAPNYRTSPISSALMFTARGERAAPELRQRAPLRDGVVESPTRQAPNESGLFMNGMKSTGRADRGSGVASAAAPGPRHPAGRQLDSADKTDAARHADGVAQFAQQRVGRAGLSASRSRARAFRAVRVPRRDQRSASFHPRICCHRRPRQTLGGVISMGWASTNTGSASAMIKGVPQACKPCASRNCAVAN